MGTLNQILLIFHFVGLAMGFSVTFANLVMMGIIDKATPPDKAVLGRFAPVMSRVSEIGLALLWATGATMVYTKWGGFGALPWQFHVKLTAVVILTVTAWFVRNLVNKAKAGDQVAMARLPTVGTVASLTALVALIFAVLAFD